MEKNKNKKICLNCSGDENLVKFGIGRFICLDCVENKTDNRKKHLINIPLRAL